MLQLQDHLWQSISRGVWVSREAQGGDHLVCLCTHPNLLSDEVVQTVVFRQVLFGSYEVHDYYVLWMEGVLFRCASREKCVLNALGVVGVPEEDWEGKCQLKCVWRKMLWKFSHPGQESRPLRVSGRRGQQTAVQYAERYSLPLVPRASSSCSSGRRFNLFWWEPTAAPTRVCLIQRGLLYPWFRQCRAPVRIALLVVQAVASGFNSMLQ